MDRREFVLKAIIDEHTKTGAPVGSGVLASSYGLECSPATIRNVMAELERDGLIVQPHTSAGRVPTEMAYRWYLENLGDFGLGKNDSDILAKVFEMEGEDEFVFKQVAKSVSEMSGGAVFWAFHRYNLYYTGISNLFTQPEFRETNLIYNISTVIDRIDEIIDEIFEDVPNKPHVSLGNDNPFGAFCSSFLVKYKRGENTGVFGIITPMRTDYGKNLGIMEEILRKIK